MKDELYTIKSERWTCPLHPKFLIRGKEADMDDFVSASYDDSRNYCCEKIRVEPVNRVTSVMKTLRKYDLTAEQMEEIQDELVSTVGRRDSCGLCN